MRKWEFVGQKGEINTAPQRQFITSSDNQVSAPIFFFRTIIADNDILMNRPICWIRLKHKSKPLSCTF